MKFLPLIVAIEGLPRSGKTTHSLLLREKLFSLSLNSIIMRGHGSRAGDNKSEYFDYNDKFWKDFRHKIKSLNFGDQDWFVLWEKANNKTIKEVNYAINLLNTANEAAARAHKGQLACDALILNRCLLSEVFFYFQYKHKLIVNKFLEGVHPDILFVLEASKDILLERSSEDNSGKANFRRKIIMNSFNSYKSVTQEIQSQLSVKLIRINTEPDISTVNEKLLSHVLDALKQKERMG